MSYLSLIKLLPELLKMLQVLGKKIERGATLAEIKNTMQKVNKAFEEKSDEKVADAIDRLWND